MKKLYYIIVILITIVLFNCLSCNIAAGSYPYAELYEFQVSEDVLIKAVDKFKSENPNYCIPEQLRFRDGRTNERDLWYHVWFYYSKENQIIKCWIRTSQNGDAVFGFIGIGYMPDLSNYKEINKDFSKQENRIQKEKFEKSIINEIKKQIQ